MSIKYYILTCPIILLLQFNLCIAIAEPVGSAFTHQGRLNELNTPTTGYFDFEFKVYDNLTQGNPIGPILTVTDTNVSKGLFITQLDFGDTVFNGDKRWIELSVRGLGDSNFTTLMPRQELTPTPYAIYAKKAGEVIGGIKGSGTRNYIAQFTDSNTIGNSIINEFSTDTTLAANSDSIVPTQKAVKTYVDNKISLPPAGTVPIGGIVSWLKSFPNTPVLSNNFVECNGQLCTDPNSPFNGQIIPNLNGEHRFLRGSTTSGATGGSETHVHELNRWNGSVSVSSGSDHVRTPTYAASTLPTYYEVVWIMRVK